MAATNLYADPDSIDAARQQAASLLCSGTMSAYSSDPEPLLLSTLLHEVAHNLGPSHEYEVGGKTASKLFGGPLASTLEELKAQTAAMYSLDWLAKRGVIPQKLAAEAHVRDIVWGFGHVAQGMVDAEGKPRSYSQLAAIQLGFFRERGSLSWRADETAANARDRGCFSLDTAGLPKAVEELMAKVAGIKARGDKVGGEGLRRQYLDGSPEDQRLRGIVRERWLRSPRASFVYAVEI
jgi:hypothetical protein